MAITDWVGVGSPVFCVVFLFIALTKGWLVPGREMDRHEKIWEARLKDAQTDKQMLQQSAQIAVESARDSIDQNRAGQAFGEAFIQALGAPKITDRQP